jgi:hypothetical protein
MDSANLSNPAHGGCNACTFNHNDQAIIVNDCAIGWIFNGCQIFYGSISLNRSKGVVFNSSIFGSCKLNSTNTQKNVNLISDCFFQTDSTVILSGNDGSTYVVNCLPAPVEPTPDPSTNYLLYTLNDSSKELKPLSTNAYSGCLGYSIPSNTHINYIDFVTLNANIGAYISGVNVWVVNQDTHTVIEQVSTNQNLIVLYSNDLQKNVVRVPIDSFYSYPVSFIVQCERTSGMSSIAYYFCGDNKLGFLLGDTAPCIGDFVQANSDIIPVCAIYSKQASP